MQLPFESDRATLFFDAETAQAVLVRREHGRHRKQPRKFKDAPAALRWCLAERFHFVMFWPPATRSN